MALGDNDGILEKVFPTPDIPALLANRLPPF